MTESPTRSVKSPASKVSGKSAPEAAPALQGATGAPLPSAMRKQMEESFGASFKDVRVNVSGTASERGARAFAQGNKVTVAPKEWQPGSRAMSRLIAHELAHVQQQRAGRVAGKGGAVNADGRLEAEADQAASRVLAGQDAGVSGGQGGASAASGEPSANSQHRRVSAPIALPGVHQSMFLPPRAIACTPPA